MSIFVVVLRSCLPQSAAKGFSEFNYFFSVYEIKIGSAARIENVLQIKVLSFVYKYIDIIIIIFFYIIVNRKNKQIKAIAERNKFNKNQRRKFRRPFR